MCELYGFSGKNRKLLNDELAEFFSHSVKNPDGWGLAAFGSRNDFIKKEAIPALKSKYLESILRDPVEAGTVVAHIRLATIGYDEYCNSHPFWGKDKSGRDWLLAHNGTIFESDRVSRYLYKQKGSTDSERVFLYLLDRVNSCIAGKDRELNEAERFELMDCLVRELSEHNKLNLLIYDGDQLFVHCNYRESLFMRQDADGITFSTKPLTKGSWEPVPFMTLTSYQNGKRIHTGTPHQNEYIPNEKNVRALYMAYAGL